MSTSPSERVSDHISFVELQKRIEKLSLPTSRSGDLTGTLQALVILELTKALSDPQTSASKGSSGEDLAFSADKIRLAKGHVLNVHPVEAPKISVPVHSSISSHPPETAEVISEEVVSHFDFDQIDPSVDSRMKDEEVLRVPLANLADYRHQAAKEITSHLGIGLRDLKDVRFAENIRPLWFSLKGSGFLDAEFNTSPEQVDASTANVIVFMTALQQGILIPSRVNPKRIELAPGKSLVFYRAELSAGSQDHWILIASILPSFRDIDLRF
jgi:hypothetical protein